MTFVCAERLGFAYSDRVRVLENVSFRLSPCWYGLIAANGLGKTTLARLIAGELEATSGDVWLEPGDSKVVLCHQELAEVTPALEQFACSVERQACRLRGHFDLHQEELARWPTLSPGERKRWQLGAALASGPDVLIVDEPTNHLDDPGRQYLIETLKRFLGVGIAISHDRELLARLTASTLRLHNGSIMEFPVSYAQARELWLADTRSLDRQRRCKLEVKHQLERRIEGVNREKQAAQRSRLAGSRMKTRHDHDGSSFAQTGRAAMGEASISRRLRVMANELARATEQVPEYAVDKTLGRSIFLGYSPAPKTRLATLAGEDLYAGNRLVVRNAQAILERETRAHLRGTNGAGKSTLLKSLMSRAAHAERLLFLPQELSDADALRIRTTALSLSCGERGRVLSLLAALGVDPDRVLGSETLSPGMARKLTIALGLGTHVHALILDEPTNHLDLPSIEHLEQALAAYPGAILLVCHDNEFAARCTSTSWEIRDQRLHTHVAESK